MSTFITIVGWLCVVSLCVAVAAIAVAIAAGYCRGALERFEWAVQGRERQRIGRSLDASGWWFSECPDASLIVRIIGQRLAKDESTDPDAMREQWRKTRQ